MIIGGDVNAGNQYQFVAYKHEDSESTYFSCSVGSVVKMGNEYFHKDLVSSVRRLTLPRKPDYNVGPWVRPDL
jgi:hypothetical protein